MDIIETSRRIEQKIAQLDRASSELKERAQAKADAIAEYDKVLAITLIKLRNGATFDLDGEKVENPSVSTSEKIAKGLCWKERLELEKTDAMYKNLIKGIESIQAQLNGYQSILRYMQ